MKNKLEILVESVTQADVAAVLSGVATLDTVGLVYLASFTNEQVRAALGEHVFSDKERKEALSAVVTRLAGRTIAAGKGWLLA